MLLWRVTGIHTQSRETSGDSDAFHRTKSVRVAIFRRRDLETRSERQMYLRGTVARPGQLNIRRRVQL